MDLTILDSDELAHIVFTVASPKAIATMLRSRPEIAATRQHLSDNAYHARRFVEEYVRSRLIDLKPKTYFLHEPAFCALAVAMEPLPIPVAEAFLSELAALKIAEMPISSRVAAICLKRRRELLISNTLAEFKVKPGTMPDASIPKQLVWIATKETRQDRIPKVPTLSTYPEILKAAA